MKTPSILETESHADYACRIQAVIEMEALDNKGKFIPEEPTLPKLSPGSYAIHNAMNCSAIFGTSYGPERPHLRTVFKATNGFFVTYSGPELRQDDKAVLLELIHRRRGMYAGKVYFAPSTFCAALGWSDTKSNVKRLRACLERMVESTLKIEQDPSNGTKFNFLQFGYAKDEDEKDARWRVTLTENIVKLFPTGIKNASFLNIEKRKLLAAGMQTWLYDYICSNNCQIVMTYASLRESCGRAGDDPKTFVEYVKAALTKLQKLGLIKGFSSVKNVQGKAGVWIDKK